NLCFDKIYHDGHFPKGSDIKQYRHTEVVREEFIPLSKKNLKGIACRSFAEKQTLLYLLKKISTSKYERYKSIITYKPDIEMFYNNGIFIKEVKYEEQYFFIKLNESAGRYNAMQSKGNDIEVNINFEWLNNKNLIVDRKSYTANINYKVTGLIKCKNEAPKDMNRVLVEVLFDNFTMYKNIMQINEIELV
ncbi:MAG: hypothetical protein R6U59_06605, partial [Eubacteriales bacterium]